MRRLGLQAPGRGGWGRIVGLHIDTGVARQRFHGQRLIAKSSCAASFHPWRRLFAAPGADRTTASPVRIVERSHCHCSEGARCRPWDRFTPPGTWTRPPSRAGVPAADPADPPPPTDR